MIAIKKIAIIDDDQIIVELLTMLIEKEENFKVVASANNQDTALTLIKETSIDLILLDIRLGKDSGLSVLKELKNQAFTGKIVMLTTFDDDQNIVIALKNGADGYLLKSSGSTSIINALKTIFDDKVVIEKEVLASIQDKLFVKKDLGNFTEKEKEVLSLLAKGHSNQEIAEQLFLSYGTIRNMVSQLLEKTQTRDRTQLVIYYYQNQ